MLFWFQVGNILVILQNMLVIVCVCTYSHVHKFVSFMDISNDAFFKLFQ